MEKEKERGKTVMMKSVVMCIKKKKKNLTEFQFIDLQPNLVWEIINDYNNAVSWFLAYEDVNINIEAIETIGFLQSEKT